MPLIYAFVSRGTNTVLADYTAYTGNFGVIAVQALERGGQGNNAKFTYSCDGHSTYINIPQITSLRADDAAPRLPRERGPIEIAHPWPTRLHRANQVERNTNAKRAHQPSPTPTRTLTPAAFNYLSSQGYTFLCVADDAYGRTIPFAFLEKVRDEWFAKWADKGASASAHALDRSFGARLKYWMEYCETHPDEVSKAAEVQKKVDEVKGIMVENIERVLERGEKIELLVDKYVLIFCFILDLSVSLSALECHDLHSTAG